MADTSYQPLTYREQGGSRFVVASGGSLDVESGGEIDVESGGSLKLAGTAITATAAEINYMDGAIFTDVTPGTGISTGTGTVRISCQSGGNGGSDRSFSNSRCFTSARNTTNVLSPGPYPKCPIPPHVPSSC